MGAEKREEVLKVRFMLDKQKSPTSEKGVKVAYGQAKRTGYRLRWFLLLAAIIAPALFTIYWILRPQIFTIAPGIVTYQPINIVAPDTSTIREMYVKVGDTVLKGQPLFLLKNEVLDQEIKYLESEIKLLQQYNAQREKDEVSLYASAKANAEKNYTEMVAIKKKYDDYFSKGHVSTADYASVLNNYYTTQSQLSDATLQLQLAKIRGADEDYVGDLSNIIRSLQVELTQKEGQEGLLLVKAPFDGRVINELGRVGERVEASTEVMTFSRLSHRAEIDAYLDAKYIEKAKLGETATIKLPNGKKYVAKVSEPTQLALKLPVNWLNHLKDKKH